VNGSKEVRRKNFTFSPLPRRLVKVTGFFVGDPQNPTYEGTYEVIELVLGIAHWIGDEGEPDFDYVIKYAESDRPELDRDIPEVENSWWEFVEAPWLPEEDETKLAKVIERVRRAAVPDEHEVIRPRPTAAGLIR